jgi:hypothetical protein
MQKGFEARPNAPGELNQAIFGALPPEPEIDGPKFAMIVELNRPIVMSERIERRLAVVRSNAAACVLSLLIERIAEVKSSLSNAAPKIRKISRTEQHKDDGQNRHDFHATQQGKKNWKIGAGLHDENLGRPARSGKRPIRFESPARFCMMASLP